MGYVMGKAEGNDKNWHGHVTALTVAPEFRRMGLAAQLMNILEEVSDKMYFRFLMLEPNFEGTMLILWTCTSERVISWR